MIRLSPHAFSGSNDLLPAVRRRRAELVGKKVLDVPASNAAKLQSGDEQNG